MNNTNIFQDYDIVVSIPVRTINDQLNHLTRLGVIRHQLIVVQAIQDGNYAYQVLDSPSQIPMVGGKPQWAYINGEVLPGVVIGASGTSLTFVLKFIGGTACFWEGEGPLAKLTEFDMTGWSYGIDVDMDLAAIAKDDIASNKAVPPNVQQQLQKFSDDLFTVNRLFMDFESTDLLRFNPVHSGAGTAGDIGLQALTTFMQFYLTDLVKSGNPYILGYSLTGTPATRYPADGQVPPSLRPVGTTYTMYHDPVNPDLSNLNFVLATEGGHAGISGSPGTFDSNWIQPAEQIDAVIVYSHAVLVERLILEPFFNALRQGVYDKIRDQIDVGIGNDYTQARSSTPSGFAYEISNVSSGDSQYVNHFVTNLTTAGDTVAIDLIGTLKFYREHSKDLGLCTARASVTASIAWSGTITLSVQKNAGGVPTLHADQAFRIDSSHHDKSENDCAKAAAVFGDILGHLVDLLTTGLTAGFFTRLFETLLTVSVPDIGNVGAALQALGGSVGSAIVMPAGQVFFFKNPSVDPLANLSVGLTYKSET